MAKEPTHHTALRLKLTTLKQADELAEINGTTRHAELVKACERGMKKPL